MKELSHMLEDPIVDFGPRRILMDFNPNRVEAYYYVPVLAQRVREQLRELLEIEKQGGYTDPNSAMQFWKLPFENSSARNVYVGGIHSWEAPILQNGTVADVSKRVAAKQNGSAGFYPYYYRLGGVGQDVSLENGILKSIGEFAGYLHLKVSRKHGAFIMALDSAYQEINGRNLEVPMRSITYVQNYPIYYL